MNKQKENKNIVLHRRFLRNYKKNTLAVFFSFVLTFLLSTALLILIHTNHKIENLKYQTKFSSSDCYITELTQQKIKQLKETKDITQIAVTQETEQYSRNLQSVYLNNGDKNYITMTAKLIQGRMPRTGNEVVAEEWTLLNLGIEPVLNQEFDISVFEEEKNKETYKLVGILSDIPINKQYGTLQLYTILDKEKTSYICYLRFQGSINYKERIKGLQQELGISKKQIHHNPAREDYQELFYIDVQLISIILLVCMIMFYGIYRISQITREKQYGILRAIGMKQRQIKHMILLELYEIYCIGAPVGMIIGFLLAFLIVKASGDGDITVYLYNQSVHFVPVVPIKQILFLTVIVAVFVGIVGYFAGRKIVRKPILELLSETIFHTKYEFHLFSLKERGGRLQTLCFLGGKYILRDIKTSFFVILTICTGVVLFIGISYQAGIAKTYQQDIKKNQYLNGQYVMSLNGYDSPFQGVSRKDVQDILALPNVSHIKTCAEIPIRVIDDGRKRNDKYYDNINAFMKEFYGFEQAGFDGVDQVFNSNLCGYNTEALKELEKYVISGNFDAKKGLKQDEIILGILSLDNTKKEEGKIAGWYKGGDKLMEYKAGDKIKIKYRADFRTEENEYIMMQDKEKEYIYKEYKVIATVCFDYMCVIPRTNVYPLLITDDKNIKGIVEDGCYQCIYIDSKDSMTLKQQKELEKRLIRIGMKGKGGIASRSMISEIEQNEMFYRKQIIYIVGIAVTTFILVLINMLNNIIYRMQVRTKEICMLRAIGMSIAMTKKVQMFENALLACSAIFMAYLLSIPILKYLYQLSDMEVYGHGFSYDYKIFLTISSVALLLCIGLSRKVLKSWKTKQIMEAVGKIE